MAENSIPHLQQDGNKTASTLAANLPISSINYYSHMSQTPVMGLPPAKDKESKLNFPITYSNFSRLQSVSSATQNRLG